MNNKKIFQSKKKKMLLMVLALLVICYLVSESNVFFMSGTERLMSHKITAMLNSK